MEEVGPPMLNLREAEPMTLRGSELTERHAVPPIPTWLFVV